MIVLLLRPVEHGMWMRRTGNPVGDEGEARSSVRTAGRPSAVEPVGRRRAGGLRELLLRVSV
jgi:hypothetical protein